MILLSEEQARATLCPALAAIAMMGTLAKLQGANVDWRDETAGNCIAASCMWWRWGTSRVAPKDTKPGTLVHASELVTLKGGYCGLAGRPEVGP